MTIRCSQPSSLRDLLAVVTSFSLLSLFLTYHLGFPAGRIQSVNSVAMRSQLNDIPQDIDYRESPFRSPKLLNILRELEKRQIWPRQRIAVLRGRVDTLSRHAFQIYNRVLHNLYFDLKNSTSPEDAAEAKLLLCLSQSDGDPDCWSRWDLQQLRPYQRVNRIPGIWDILWWRTGLCRTVSRLQSLTTLAAKPLSPLCYPLPEQYEDFLNTADGPGFNLSWILKPSSGGTALQHLSTMQIFNRVRLKEFPEGQEGLVQQFVPNQLHVLGFPVSVQLFVLVTSIAPLRVYLFREGIVHFRRDEDHGYKKIPGKWWLLSQLWRHVGATQGAAAVRLALDHTDSLLVHLLLGAEAFLLVQLAGLPPLEQADSRTGERIRYRCEQCYQLLAVELMYNTSLYPFVMSVNGQPIESADVRSSSNSPTTGSESLVTRSQESLLQTLVTDSLELQFATDSVHRSVFELLQKAEEKHNTGITGLQCLISHDLCLTEEDLLSLLMSRREMLHTGGFRRLYPSESGSRYTAFLQDLQALTLQDPRSEFQPANHLLRETLRHSTADLHAVQTRLEQVVKRQQGSREEYFLVQGSDIETGEEGDNDEDEGEDYAYPADARPPISLSLQSVQSRRHSIRGGNCSQDESLVAYLKEFVLQPSVTLDPPFTPLWTEYRGVVQYDVTMVRITAVPMHCRVQARYEHHQGPTGSLNTTLGLGSNRIVVLVQDVASSTTINTYLLTLTRYPASHSEPKFEPSHSYAVCGLRQECEYQIAPKEPCGLQQETPPSLAAWTNTLAALRHLPSCPAGDAFGRWLVPCSSCSKRSTCIWSQLRWQPYSCSHRLVPRDQLATCLMNKKLLFIGDSTNRGMMHYIMEQLNGSLAACDKTHHIRVYSSLNQGRTTLSFAYYPQFWLSAPERPVFDKTLYQLLLKSQPLQNTSDTVVIVGGVHWLATQHLHTLLRVLRREGLQGAHLFVKTLGSGFHIPAEGVHYLPKEQRERLLMHSMGLAAFARHHHMDVVDTLNMTAARYKDFLQGKCACHFHKLEARGDFGSGYRVEGPINALYTEILLSRLCGV